MLGNAACPAQEFPAGPFLFNYLLRALHDTRYVDPFKTGDEVSSVKVLEIAYQSVMFGASRGLRSEE